VTLQCQIFHKSVLSKRHLSQWQQRPAWKPGSNLLKCFFINRLQNFEVFQHVLWAFLYGRLDADVMSYLFDALNQQILLMLRRWNQHNSQSPSINYVGSIIHIHSRTAEIHYRGDADMKLVQAANQEDNVMKDTCISEGSDVPTSQERLHPKY